MTKKKKQMVTIDVTKITNGVNAVSASDYPKVYQITYEISKIGIVKRLKTWFKKLFKKLFKK